MTDEETLGRIRAYLDREWEFTKYAIRLPGLNFFMYPLDSRSPEYEEFRKCISSSKSRADFAFGSAFAFQDGRGEYTCEDCSDLSNHEFESDIQGLDCYHGTCFVHPYEYQRLGPVSEAFRIVDERMRRVKIHRCSLHQDIDSNEVCYIGEVFLIFRDMKVTVNYYLEEHE